MDLDDKVDVDDGREHSEDVLLCSSYEIVPQVSAVHPCSIFALAATKNMKWVFTGGDDGFIRKYDFLPSMNGDQSLTQNQRHGLPDSVQKVNHRAARITPVKLGIDVINEKAGVLVSAWEHEEFPVKASSDVIDPNEPKTIKYSPVFSLEVQSEGIFALAGTEVCRKVVALTTSTLTESINDRMATLIYTQLDMTKERHHDRPVSCLKLAADQRSFISGSWDKQILHWDLDTGQLKSQYPSVTSQITSLSYRPSSSPSEGTNASPDSLLLVSSFDGKVHFIDPRAPNGVVKRWTPSGVPPWTLSACWSFDGKRVYSGRRNGSVDEWDFLEEKVIQNIKLPRDSGPVSTVASMANGRSLICGSYDNVRLWDLQYSEADQNPDMVEHDADGLLPVVVPFSIVPGHHGGTLSNIFIDDNCKYMITCSGNRGWEGFANNLCLWYNILPVHTSKDMDVEL
ncbi:Transcription factor spt8 [Blyttiomyces sp. JEL0837]|nr:Transcription factor spt8 [Blyttiomyces sp. JEL0837]